MTLLSLNACSRQCSKSYFSGRLYKTSFRTGLDLSSKNLYKNIFSINTKFGFRLNEIEFLSKQATPPLWDRSNITRSYSSILSLLLKSVLSSLVSLNPITVAF